jgi:hypothetical protein
VSSLVQIDDLRKADKGIQNRFEHRQVAAWSPVHNKAGPLDHCVLDLDELAAATSKNRLVLRTSRRIVTSAIDFSHRATLL